MDIKKQAGNNPYAFIQFVELSSAIQARKRMDREFVGRNRVKVHKYICDLESMQSYNQFVAKGYTILLMLVLGRW